MKKYLLIFLSLILAGCGADKTSSQSPMMGGGGGDSGMMARHHAQVPEDYVGKAAPETTDESLARGADIYKINCVSCHGETGAGDGAAGAALNPLPAPISHTTQMLADNLVFYRISEGGVPFQTSMPAWKGVMTEEQIWDVIAYVRALGEGNAAQIDQMRAAQQEKMLTDALSQGAITESQAETFRAVHTALEGYMKSNTMQGTMSERESSALAALVESGELTQGQVDGFNIVHAILSTGGFMP